MKAFITVLLVLALYGCIAGGALWFGHRAAALMCIALVLMGILEGII